MHANKRNNFSKKSGMTIVEVATVVSVLIVLVAIVITVFPGIQDRAKSGQAKSNAASVEKIAESFAEATGRYPGMTSEFRSNARLSSEISLLVGAASLSASNGQTSVDYDIVGTSVAASGARIRYWDYQKAGGSGIATLVIYLGSATSASTFTDLAS